MWALLLCLPSLYARSDMIAIGRKLKEGSLLSTVYMVPNHAPRFAAWLTSRPRYEAEWKDGGRSQRIHVECRRDDSCTCLVTFLPIANARTSRTSTSSCLNTRGPGMRSSEGYCHLQIYTGHPNNGHTALSCSVEKPKLLAPPFKDTLLLIGEKLNPAYVVPREKGSWIVFPIVKFPEGTDDQPIAIYCDNTNSRIQNTCACTVTLLQGSHMLPVTREFTCANPITRTSRLSLTRPPASDVFVTPRGNCRVQIDTEILSSTLNNELGHDSIPQICSSKPVEQIIHVDPPYNAVTKVYTIGSSPLGTDNFYALDEAQNTFLLCGRSCRCFMYDKPSKSHNPCLAASGSKSVGQTDCRVIVSGTSCQSYF